MPRIQNNTTLFGMDLAPLGRDLVSAWRGMLNWPVLAWLSPKPTISLRLADGQQAINRGPSTPVETNAGPSKTPQFQALVLPESILLRRKLVLPLLAQAEFDTALALQVHTFSPFASQDLVWTHETQEAGANLQVQATLCSRPLISAHLQAIDPTALLSDFEVWIPSTQTRTHVLVPGFAENRRQSHRSAWRWASAALLVAAMAMVIALIATPSLQLYLRSKQAEAGLSFLQQKASPVLSERENFNLATEKLQHLNDMFAASMPPMPVLQLITVALADDTSLLSLQIQGDKVSLTGQTDNTSVLMKQLSTTTGLKDIRAPAPATKPLGAIRESFTLEFTIGPEFWTSVAYPIRTERANPTVTPAPSNLNPTTTKAQFVPQAAAPLKTP